MKKQTLLVSSCLLGVCCRYDQKTIPVDNVLKLKEKYHLIPVCPEQLGGLSTPRPPAEIQKDKVIAKDGTDVTSAYQLGAKEALRIAHIFECNQAVLKERSPSCGSNQIYDGTFQGILVHGNGITANLFKKNGIKVFGESELDQLL